MNGVIDYICDDMRSTRIALRHVNKTLKKQGQTDRNITVLMLAMIFCTAGLAVEQVKHEKRIRELEKKIEELTPEGA